MKMLMKGLAVAITASVIIIACSKNDRMEATASQENFDAKTVKDWYYGTFKRSAEWQQSPQKGKKLPDWDHAVTGKIGNNEVIEFPLVEEGTAYPISAEQAGKTLTNAEITRTAEAAVTRITFIKQPNGSIEVRETDFIPSWDHLQQKNYDISKTSMLNAQNDFTGRAIVKKWNGEVISSASITNGKITGWGKRTNGAEKNSLTETEDCTYETFCIWQQDCNMQIYGDGAVIVECGAWYNTGECWQEVICNNNGDECELYGINCNNNGDDPTLDPIIINTVTDPCIHANVDLAVNGGCQNEVSQVINNVFGNSSDFHIRFKDANVVGTGADADASTSWFPLSGDVWAANIVFNNTVLDNASQEYIAATILHELVHAWIDYQFPVLPANSQQHNLMASTYRFNLMRDALMEICPNLSLQDATDLTWGGMDNTVMFQTLPISERQRIIDRNNEFKNGNAGTPCP